MDTIRILEDIAEEQTGVQEKAAMADAIHAVQKQTAPDGPRVSICPRCGERTTLFDDYCSRCGQRLPLWKGWEW